MSGTPAPAPPPRQLTITVVGPDQLQLDGPIHDKLFCLDLLAKTMRCVLDYNPAQHGGILLAGPLPPGLKRVDT